LKRKGKGLKKSSTLVVKQDYFDNSLFSQRLSASAVNQLPFLG
jgi:hypothetical protein